MDLLAMSQAADKFQEQMDSMARRMVRDQMFHYYHARHQRVRLQPIVVVVMSVVFDVKLLSLSCVGV